MFIHNFYSDILLSTRVLFDNYIFHRSDYIKKYEFNYGNRAFQLDSDYKQNFEFPIMLVNLNNQMSTFGQRTENLHPIGTPNKNQIPVLYNKTNDTILYIQEEQTSITLSITINCESQFQAKEIEHVIQRFLPLNKYIGIFKYTSFLEVSTKFLKKHLFDVNNHEIINIYDKLNKNTGKLDHFFSIQYDPILRNESLTTTISDSAQRSFQVVLDLTYMLQLPIFAFDVKTGIVDSINVNFGNFGNEPISAYPIQKIINDDTDKSLHQATIKRQLLFSDDDIIEQTDELTRVILKPHKDSIKLTEDLTYNFINSGQKINNIKQQFFELENKVVFEFPTTYFDDAFKIGLDSPLVIQIVEPVSTRLSCPNLNDGIEVT